MKTERPARLASLVANSIVLRNVVVALCGACALVYFAIGLGLVYEQKPEGVQLWAFGFSAALAFGLGVVLMLARSGRVVWILGALFMVLAIVAYLAVSPRRDPSFEIWGISLKIAQVAILAALLGLLVHDRSPHGEPAP
jgi:hypothetical protein